MRLRLRQLLLPLEYDPPTLRAEAAARLGCPPERLAEVTPLRRSIDSRRRHQVPQFCLEVVCRLHPGPRPPRARPPWAEPLPDPPPARPDPPAGRSTGRPVVVGAGPAGLMAALALAEAGRTPLLVDRGEAVDQRVDRVAAFWSAGRLDPDSNTLFGEGGAGLFSDGKLTARGKDRARIQRFLDVLVSCGAPEEIRIDAEPHLGSDLLARLVPALRQRIERAGGETRFGCRLTGIERVAGRLRRLHFGPDRVVETDTCVLATGHSARDVFRLLVAAGVNLEGKPLAIGIRLEVPQPAIDRARWGRWAGHPRLGAASFRLAHPAGAGGRACYTFCMCPGGTVMCCASEPGGLTTNGMSLAARAGPLGNAAFLVPVGPDDFPSPAAGDPPALAGLRFQDQIEQAAFAAGGGDYSLPASPLADFLADRPAIDLPEMRSCRRCRPADLGVVLPGFIQDTLRWAIPPMLRQLGLPLDGPVLLYAAETRSSSPVRIPRRPDGQSPDTLGLYPVGEGAGAAGGIVSAAVDGLRAADRILGRDSSPNP